MHVLLADESRGIRAIQRSILRKTRYTGDPIREIESGDQLAD